MNEKIPKSWKIKRLGDFLISLPKSKLQSGLSDKTGYYNFYVCSQNILKSFYNEMSSPAVLFSTGGEAAVHYAIGEYSYSTDVWATNFTGEIYDEYGFRLLEKDLEKINYSGFQGSGIKHLDKKFVKKLTYAIPPLSEQKKIAFILTSVDELIENIQKKIDKLQDLRKAIMNELLTKGIGHTEFKDNELGKIPKSWEFKKLSEVCKIKHGFAFPGEYFTNEINDYILLTPGNFNVNGSLYYGSKTKYYTGEIPKNYVLSNDDLIVVMTDLTSQMAILGNAVILNSSRLNLHNQRIGKVVNIHPSISSEFLSLIFNSRPVKQNVKKTAIGTTVRHTSPTKMLDVSFSLPTLPEQKKIVSVLDLIGNVIDKQVIKLSQTKSLKKSLMQNLLTGKVRVQVN